MAVEKQFNNKHYGGLEFEKPNILPYGDTYFSQDTGSLFKYNKEGVGVRIQGASNQIVVTKDNYEDTLGGTIDSTKEYFIDGVINIGTTQIRVPEGGIRLQGYSAPLSGLISTEDNHTMFINETAICGTIFLSFLYIIESGTNSKVYDLVNDGTGFYFNSGLSYINCTSLGELDSFSQGVEENVIKVGGSPSLTLSGAWEGWGAKNIRMRDMSNTTTKPLFDKGTNFTMNSRFAFESNIDLGTLQPFLGFEPANFPNPSTLQLRDCQITRGGIHNSNDANLTPNILASNLSSIWKSNFGIQNTYVGGEAAVTTQIETVITTIGVAVDLAGTWTNSDLQHFDSPSNGKLRHLGNNPRNFTISFSFVLEAGPGDEYEVELIRHNGSPEIVGKQDRIVSNSAGSRNVAYFQKHVHLTLDQNETIYFQVKNLSSTANCTLEFDSEWDVEER